MPWDCSYKLATYAFVSLDNMTFEDLADAQQMCEEAAVLQYKGVGVSK